MSGLDPFGRRDVRELILEQRARGTTCCSPRTSFPTSKSCATGWRSCSRAADARGDGGRTGVRQRQRVEVPLHGGRSARGPAGAARCEARRSPNETAFQLEDDTALNETLTWLLGCGAEIRRRDAAARHARGAVHGDRRCGEQGRPDAEVRMKFAAIARNTFRERRATGRCSAC
jgi:hypothetical protein